MSGLFAIGAWGRPLARAWLPSLLAGLLLGCAPPAGHELQPGRYRATVAFPGNREVPFALEVTREGPKVRVAVGEGDTRAALALAPSPAGQLAGSTAGGVRIVANIAGDRLKGSCTLAGADGRPMTLPFEAERGQAPRFYRQPLTDNADFSGRWALTLTDDRGGVTRAVAILDQSFERVTGRVEGPGAAPIALVGEARDEELRLGRFDGTVAVLVHVHVGRHGELLGELWSTREGHRRVAAVRAAPSAAPTGP